MLDWFVQMSLALQYLHSKRVLHRDLKTANVFLTGKGIVKLGDFGVGNPVAFTKAIGYFRALLCWAWLCTTMLCVTVLHLPWCTHTY